MEGRKREKKFRKKERKKEIKEKKKRNSSKFIFRNSEAPISVANFALNEN
jgi:hypothetical protein